MSNPEIPREQRNAVLAEVLAMLLKKEQQHLDDMKYAWENNQRARHTRIVERSIAVDDMIRGIKAMIDAEAKTESPAAPPTTEILHLRDYQRHHLHQAIQHTGAMQQMFFNKAAAARDIERTLVTLMGADHD